MPEDEAPVSDAGQQTVGVELHFMERTVPGCMENEENLGPRAVVPKPEERNPAELTEDDVVPNPSRTLDAQYLDTLMEINRRLERLEAIENKLDVLLAKLPKTLEEHGNLLSNITTKADIYGKDAHAYLESNLAETRKILLWLEMNSPRKENSKYYEAMNPMLVEFFNNLFVKYTGIPLNEILAEITSKDIKKITNDMLKNKEKDGD